MLVWCCTRSEDSIVGRSTTLVQVDIAHQPLVGWPGPESLCAHSWSPEDQSCWLQWSLYLYFSATKIVKYVILIKCLDNYYMECHETLYIHSWYSPGWFIKTFVIPKQLSKKKKVIYSILQFKIFRANDIHIRPSCTLCLVPINVSICKMVNIVNNIRDEHQSFRELTWHISFLSGLEMVPLRNPESCTCCNSISSSLFINKVSFHPNTKLFAQVSSFFLLLSTHLVPAQNHTHSYILYLKRQRDTLPQWPLFIWSGRCMKVLMRLDWGHTLRVAAQKNTAAHPFPIFLPSPAFTC